MAHVLNQEQLDYLHRHFRVTTQLSCHRAQSISAIQLLHPIICDNYLNKVGIMLESPSKQVSASQFSKRYAFLIVVPALYTMSVYNKGLNVSLENSHIDSMHHDQHWMPTIRLESLEVTDPAPGRRHVWRDQVLQTIFAHNLAKVWQALAKTANISKNILWENTAIYVYWIYETRMEQETNKEIKGRISEDFNYLVNEAPPYLFGESENPLKKYYHRPTTYNDEKQPVRIRKTCCLYDQLPSSAQDYCQTCPKKYRNCARG